MNFDIKWDEKYYKLFIDYLYSLKDEKYKNFHSKLILKNNLIGIRTPILKKIAKEISKYDYKNFIKFSTNNTYEEITIKALLIGYLKDYNETIYELDNILTDIDNWATCDLMCSNLKIFAKNKDKGFKYIKSLIKGNEEWKIRVGLVLLLNYYIDDEYIDKIFILVNNINCEQYYVKMAISWLLSICYIKYPQKSTCFLKNNTLSDWVHNKTIQKIKESNRVSYNKKIAIDKLKRKIPKTT